MADDRQPLADTTSPVDDVELDPQPVDENPAPDNARASDATVASQATDAERGGGAATD